MAKGTSAIDPSNFASLGLTHVQYDPEDSLAKLLALVTLSPIFLLCSYVTIILLRRELTFINALIGQLACEGLNWALKRLIKQPRPTGHLGAGYGMPSSHSQFLGFFAAFFLSHFYLNRPQLLRPRTLINSMRRFEHALAMVLIASISILTCYSRHHLHYHTSLQIVTGLSIGLVFGGVYYYVTEHLSRKPLRLPAPLAVSESSSPLAIRANRLLQPIATFTPAKKPRQDKNSIVRHRKPRRRSSTLSDIILPELHPAPPIRQILLDHPIAIAFRIRDSWAVWTDGGIEGEYGAWRREWEARRASATPVNGAAAAAANFARGSDPGRLPRHYAMMAMALSEADKSPPTDAAFCVGCVICPTSDAAASSRKEILATGFSRELPGNTHAEQCALDKIASEFKSESRPWSDKSISTLDLDLYTTMEPCSERLSGNLPCVQRILKFNEQAKVYYLPPRLAQQAIKGGNVGSGDNVQVILRIRRVFQGVAEPDDFVKCQSQNILRGSEIQVFTVKGSDDDDRQLEQDCLRVARKGHPAKS
ncbi:related to CAX4 - required for full levels of dolichol-linked oligosaccharides [Melanopsichium pennsylvanicum]|uniref:Dolichyldiphosphatase n=2 Tax=Melanopsichium pennsylvanicum TaxID=63383 RepID=A0AAJ4XNS8_9BASI|nr:related to CAX4-required for full levels of dolichol-linked oligosaccharides [Melanopsichium pennsylvanicum 4]SNX86349.1 related to CAX4 - required for full levels of dolichol-linked oligosaccharides [Melanopsichium pennsylvanicum]